MERVVGVVGGGWEALSLPPTLRLYLESRYLTGSETDPVPLPKGLWRRTVLSLLWIKGRTRAEKERVRERKRMAFSIFFGRVRLVSLIQPWLSGNSPRSALASPVLGLSIGEHTPGGVGGGTQICFLTPRSRRWSLQPGLGPGAHVQHGRSKALSLPLRAHIHPQSPFQDPRPSQGHAKNFRRTRLQHILLSRFSVNLPIPGQPSPRPLGRLHSQLLSPGFLRGGWG